MLVNKRLAVLLAEKDRKGIIPGDNPPLTASSDKSYGNQLSVFPMPREDRRL